MYNYKIFVNLFVNSFVFIIFNSKSWDCNGGRRGGGGAGGGRGGGDGGGGGGDGDGGWGSGGGGRG